MALDHSCSSDYVWQLELRREAGQVTASFREVRLPRSLKCKYPRNPSSLADEWNASRCYVGSPGGRPSSGLYCAMVEHASAIAWVTDVVVPLQRDDRARPPLF